MPLISVITSEIQPPAKPYRKGARYFFLGKPISSNPYANPTRKDQFDAGWQEAESYSEYAEFERDRDLA